MAQKRFFWFGEEPVESKNLASYLRGEKDSEAANHNAAWSSYTGKGLLYFSKSSGEKATPAGIINLVSSSSPRLHAAYMIDLEIYVLTLARLMSQMLKLTAPLTSLRMPMVLSTCSLPAPVSSATTGLRPSRPSRPRPRRWSRR